MSRTHIRGRRARPTAKRNRLAEILVKVLATAAIGLIAVLFVLGRMPRFSTGPVETAAGAILETRINTMGHIDSGHGGYTLYRIEAHVNYSVHGAVRERWLPASDLASDRATLQMRILQDPKTCLVTWVRYHEDNARCPLN